MSEAERLARAYWDSEESRDLDRILAHFLPDASWFGPEGRDYHGVAELQTFYAESIATYPAITITVVESLGDLDRCAIRWHAELTDHAGSRSILDGVNFMTFIDNRIASLAAFFDPIPRSV